MILIADSGSTKTDWRLWNKDTNEVLDYSSKGLNPYFVNSAEIALEVQNIIPSEYVSTIRYIYFYGSGAAHSIQKNCS